MNATNEPTQESPETPEPTMRLDHFLQACGVQTGGQAKQLIQGGDVLLNGVVETRRRKKLRAGDEVEFMGEVYEVAPVDADEPAEQDSEVNLEE